MPLTLGTQIRNPEGTPGLSASPYEWQVFRQLQAMKQGFSGTNASGMTPQGMETAATAGAEENAMREALNSLMDPAMGTGSIPTAKAPTAPEPAPVQDTPVGDSSSIIAMAFPEVFLRQPPSGEVNTKGGADRVNARTSETGARAITGKDGKITLTNINSDGSVNQGTGSPNSIGGDGMGGMSGRSTIAPNTPFALNNAVDMLRGAKDIASAQGIMININQTIAEQTAKINKEAIEFAGNKVGLPALEASLLAVQQQERADPRWFPGIGDSTAAIQIRNDIQAANQALGGIAQKYVASNVNQSALTSMAQNATMVYDSIKRREEIDQRQRERTEIKTDATLAANKEWRERKDYVEEQKIDAAVPNLSSEEINRIAILDATVNDPMTKISDPVKAKKAAYALKSTNPQKYQEAVFGTAMDQPAFAMAGNPYSMAIVVAEERKKDPRITSDAVVQEKIARIKSNALKLTDKEIDDFKIKQSGTSDTKAAKEALANQRSMGMLAGTPKGERAKQLDFERYQIALEMERVGATNRAIMNTGSLLNPEGPFGPAIAEAQKVTNGTRLEDVFAAYKGTRSGVDSLSAAKEFNTAIESASMGLPDSMFGRPDIDQIRKHLLESQRATLRDFLGGILQSRTDSPFVFN